MVAGVQRVMVVVAASVALVLGGPTVAGPQPANPGFSLTVSPARPVVVAPVGATTTVLKASNGGSNALHVEVKVSEFAQAANGDVTFIEGDPRGPTHWVKPEPTSFDLQPGTTQAVTLAIEVPGDADPGDHQVAVLFQVPALAGEANVAINRSIGVQVLLAVPGPVERRVRLVRLSGPRLVDGGAPTFRLTVRNEGTVHRDFVAGEALVARDGHRRVPFPDFSVLRGSTRIVKADWMDPPLLCRCEFSVAVDDGTGQVVTATTTVFVFPVRFVLGVVVTGIGLAVLLRAARHRRRRRLDELIEDTRAAAFDEARREQASEERRPVR